MGTKKTVTRKRAPRTDWLGRKVYKREGTAHKRTPVARNRAGTRKRTVTRKKSA